MNQNKQNPRLELVITEILIGEEITATYKDNPRITFSGTVINETKHTIHLEISDRVLKILPKDRIIIEKYYKKQKLKINGSLYKGLPEARIKQEPRKFW